MILDFQSIDLNSRPSMILRNLDGVAFGALGLAFNIQADFKYNEVSELSFEIPAYDNGEKTPFYDEIKGMVIFDLMGYGQFILKEAHEKTDGVKTTKVCTCYSLEFEMAYKQFFVEKGTYNFWNPTAPNNTILGMILETIPYWSIGTVDTKLIGKYRTFEANNVTILDFIKNTAQETYRCVFTFDTYKRKINVVDASSFVATTPVYLSLYNLIKDIEITEDTENVATCLEAHGADGVTIRSVNPLGTNKIYALDYYMTETNVSASIISKWNAWKELFKNRQLPYYHLKIEESSQTARLLTEESVLNDMKAELKNFENQQAVSIQYLAEHPNDVAEKDRLDKTNFNITTQKTKIKAHESYIQTIKSDLKPIKMALKNINDELAFETTFTQSEILSLSKFIKESSIQESSFVISQVKNYNTADISGKYTNSAFGISNSIITTIPNENNKELYSIVGGTLLCPCGDDKITANIVRGSMERKTDGAFVFSAYLNQGTVNKDTFPSGNISATGACGGINFAETSLSFSASTASVYFTQNATEYEARSVQFDLFEYATDCLNKMSVPTYTFNVNPANFLALGDFAIFKNNFELGKKIYLDIGSRVLEPITIGVSLNFEDYTNFSIEFSNSFRTNDPEFQLVDQLKQGISMGKTVDSCKNNYSSFQDSGAGTNIKEFMDNALDLVKNEIMASTGQAISINENGMRLRKWNATRTDYENEQLWGINNSIAMTNDNWASAKMAIGKFSDPKHGTLWGVNAELLAGKAIIGNNFSFECPSADGKAMQFVFDANGALLNNSKLYLQRDGGGKISIDPEHGILIGNNTLYDIDASGNHIVNEANANLWMDTKGFIHAKGMSVDGGIIKGGEIYIGGAATASNCTFGVDSNGNILGIKTANGMAQIGKDGKVTFGSDVSISGDLSLTGNINLSAGNINWGNNTPNKKRYATTETGTWHSEMQNGDVYCCDWNYTTSMWGAAYKFKGQDGQPGQNGTDGSDANVPEYIKLKGIDFTSITGASVSSPTILGGVIKGADIYGGNFYDLNGIGRLNLSNRGGGCSDLIFGNGKNNYEIFKVYDNIGGATLSIYGIPIVTAHSGTGTAHLESAVKVEAVFG